MYTCIMLFPLMSPGLTVVPDSTPLKQTVVRKKKSTANVLLSSADSEEDTKKEEGTVSVTYSTNSIVRKRKEQ